MNTFVWTGIVVVAWLSFVGACVLMSQPRRLPNKVYNTIGKPE
jgi:hypothetical protein